MREILVLLLKTLGLKIIGLVGASACIWIPITVDHFAYLGEVAYCILIVASFIITIITVIWVQLKLDSLWSN